VTCASWKKSRGTPSGQAVPAPYAAQGGVRQGVARSRGSNPAVGAGGKRRVWCQDLFPGPVMPFKRQLQIYNCRRWVKGSSPKYTGPATDRPVLNYLTTNIRTLVWAFLTLRGLRTCPNAKLAMHLFVQRESQQPEHSGVQVNGIHHRGIRLRVGYVIEKGIPPQPTVHLATLTTPAQTWPR